MSAQIKNFQYIDVDSSFVYLKHEPGSVVIEVQEPIYESLKVKTIQEANFFRS